MSISGLRVVITAIVFCIVCIQGYASAVLPANTSGISSMNEQIKAGIENVVRIVSPRLDPSVESYLRVYIERNRTKTENMIGRSSLYFPMFEEHLAAAGLPVDLKYLAVVESALTPHAISRVGATGLWQFMRPTAREYGLQITKYIDERCDPVMSTKAAITYLNNLFRQFDSWELAMAAYNAGPGRVRYAIRKSGTKDYWKLQGYLPKETRSYVPGFIAASYVLNYYQDHGLQPAFPGSDMMMTATIPVFKNLDFTQIQQVTGVPYDVISNLNPKYIKDFIPQSEGGHILVLPSTAAATMAAFLNADGDVATLAHTEFMGIETGVEMEYVNRLIEHTYVVKSGDNLYSLAKKHHCTVSELQKWNKLSGTMLRIGQRLKIMKMERVLVKVAQPVSPVVTPVPPRKNIDIARLDVMPGSATIGGQFALEQKAVTREPMLKASLDLSGSAMILRRRMSARDLGVIPAESSTAIMPGARLN